jgi:hypothetical protein
MAALLDLCRFNPTAGSTTDWTFSSAVTGYQSPALAGVVNGRAYKYRAESSDLSQWELGEGTYNTGTGVLTRTTVLYNSSGTGTGVGQSGAGTKINFSTVPQVAIVMAKEDYLSIEEANAFTVAQQAQAKSNIAVGAVAQCILSKVSTNIVLSPKNGNLLTIAGVQYAIPAAGVSLPATGLTAGTLYYIYAFMSSGTMTLEASTTAHSTDTTTANSIGMEYKTGDTSRTLVGMVRPIAGPAFADTTAQRFVRSYFNSPPLALSGAFTANRSTSSTSFVEVNTEIRCEFLSFVNEVVSATIAAIGTHATSGENIHAAVGFDGATAEEGGVWVSEPVANFQIPIFAKAEKGGLTEGYHYATLLGKTSTGTANYMGSATVGARTSLELRI